MKKEQNNKAIKNKYILASAGTDKTVRLWEISQPSSFNMGGTYTVASSPSAADIFATAGFDGKIKLWLQNNGNNNQQLIDTLSGHNSTINSRFQYYLEEGSAAGKGFGKGLNEKDYAKSRKDLYKIGE